MYQNEMMAYPNPTPSQLYEPLPDFYTHDQALPFSPSATTFGQIHPQPGQAIYRGLRQGVDDMVFSTFPDVQSPTMAYLNQNGQGAPSRPMSARWVGFDMAKEPFGLGFNEHDLMLNEYGSALAQVDDTSVW
jgi:hypothetical protein